MRIIIRDPEGRKFDLDVSGSTGIIKLNDLLSSKYHVTSKLQFLFHGVHMEDDESLDYYDVEDGDMIEAVRYFAVGGGPPFANETYSSNINCIDKRGKIGEYYCYKIIGSTEGTVWGDGVYTDDSNIAKAAVLEGKCKIGENNEVCIKIIEGKSSYGSCTKNGISTSSYGSWDGSYIFS